MGTIYRNGVPFVGSGGAGGVEMTQAEYDLLPTSEKMNGAIYFITDGDVSYPTASQMRYDNTESQIPSTTVQGAIDENRIEINSLKSGLMNVARYSLSLPSGWSSEYVVCKKVGKTVFISCMLVASTAQTVKSFAFNNIIPEDIYCPNRIAFAAFDNSTDTSLHGILQGRTMTLYRQETTSLTRIEFNLVYSLI